MGFIEYSFSKLDDANYCLMRYYLRWVEKVAHPTPPFFFKGGLFHNIIENFWGKLGTPEEVTMPKNKRNKDGKKYSSKEEFANYVSGQWMHEVMKNKHSRDPSRKVEWEFEGQEFAMANESKAIAYHLFDHLIEIGKPLYQEIKFDFFLGHRRFKGRIDGVRFEDGKITIEDYKTGQPKMGEMKVKHDPQMTMYNVGLAALCFSSERFARSLGLQDRRMEFLRDPTYLIEEVQNRFIMLEAPYSWTKKNKPGASERIPFIHPTYRTKAHFYEILKMLDGVEKSIKHGIIYPERGRKCDSCVMKKACEQKLEDAVRDVPEGKHGQKVFTFAAPVFSFTEETDTILRQLDFFKKERKQKIASN